MNKNMVGLFHTQFDVVYYQSAQRTSFSKKAVRIKVEGQSILIALICTTILFNHLIATPVPKHSAFMTLRLFVLEQMEVFEVLLGLSNSVSCSFVGNLRGSPEHTKVPYYQPSYTLSGAQSSLFVRAGLSSQAPLPLPNSAEIQKWIWSSLAYLF